MKSGWKEKAKSVLREWIKKERMLVIILLGIFFMVVTVPTKNKEGSKGQLVVENEEQKGSEASGVYAYQEALEKQLEELIETIAGIEDVKVMITLKNMGEKEVLLESDIERKETQEIDSEGGSRSVVEEKIKEEKGGNMSMGQSDSPFVISEHLPQIEGVVVVVKCKKQGAIERELTQAVSALFDIEIHKVKVLKMD